MPHVYPAIDLLGGQCVRLHKGDYAAVTVYASNPAQPQGVFQSSGIRRMHVVDLDAARGQPTAATRAAVESLVQRMPGGVQVGGGVRSEADVERWLDLGVWRVVVGTVAGREPERVCRWAERWPGRIVAGLDAREGVLQAQGWTQAGQPLQTVCELYRGSAIAAVLFTAIERDGTMQGPDLPRSMDVARWSGKAVIVSGGISGPADVDAILAAPEDPAATVDGVIVGRAWYEQRITAMDLRRWSARC